MDKGPDEYLASLRIKIADIEQRGKFAETTADLQMLIYKQNLLMLDFMAQLLATSKSSTVQPNPALFGIDNLKIVTVGVAMQLPPIAVPDGMSAVLRAHPDNQGVVYLAVSKQGAEGHSDEAFPLLAGEALDVKVAKLSIFWFDATDSSDKIVWAAEQEEQDGQV